MAKFLRWRASPAAWGGVPVTENPGTCRLARTIAISSQAIGFRKSTPQSSARALTSNMALDVAGLPLFRRGLCTCSEVECGMPFIPLLSVQGLEKMDGLELSNLYCYKWQSNV